MLSIFTEFLRFLSGPSVINRSFGMFELVELSGVGKRYIRNIYYVVRCYMMLCYTMLYYIDITYLALCSWEKITLGNGYGTTLRASCCSETYFMIKR